MIDGTRVPAGWYPDPLGLPQLRWWDTTEWTEHTSDARQPEPATAVPVLAPVPAAEADASPPALMPLGSTTPVAAASDGGGSPILIEDEARRLPADHFPPIEPVAPSASWGALRRVVLGAERDPRPIEVHFADRPPLLVDPANGVYWWDRDAAALPAHADGTRIHRLPAMPPLSALGAGREWEPLLWAVGMGSAVREDDPSLLPGARYRLRRWPNLTALAHTADHMTMTAMLAHAHLTTDELASLAGAAPQAAVQLVATLQLMGLLIESAPVEAETPVADPRGATRRPEGLLARLRARLGR